MSYTPLKGSVFCHAFFCWINEMPHHSPHSHNICLTGSSSCWIVRCISLFILCNYKSITFYLQSIFDTFCFTILTKPIPYQVVIQNKKNRPTHINQSINLMNGQGCKYQTPRNRQMDVTDLSNFEHCGGYICQGFYIPWGLRILANLPSAGSPPTTEVQLLPPPCPASQLPRVSPLQGHVRCT